MDKIKIKLAFIIILFTFIITPTICAFVKNVEKTGSIQAKELSTTFLNDTDFLTKVQTLDPTITSIDKNTDLTRTNTIANENLTDSNIVSTSTSSVPTYLWIENNTIYYYTVATSIDLNSN